MSLLKIYKSKVAIFVPSFYGGGAERVMVNLARGFSSRVASVDLIVAVNKGAYSDQVSDISVVDLKSNCLAASLIPLVKYLRINKPDILLASMPYPNLIAIIAAIIAGGKTRVVISSHENVTQRWRHGSLKDKVILIAAKFAYRFADSLIAVSSGTLMSDKQFFGNAIPSNTCFTYNPIIDSVVKIHKQRFFSTPSDKNRKVKIVTAGRLSYEKDYETLLRAFAEVQATYNCCLTVYGEGPLRGDLQNSAAKLGVAHLVDFPGFTNNLDEILLGYDIFVLTSLWEGFGNVLVEALAAGCAVVSTDCPTGPREILADGKYGLLSPVGDSNALASAIKSVIEGHSPIYDTKDAVSPYLTNTVVNQYLSFFEDILIKL
jgi:glycosyltransferase involved in cell wall biosynthesis